MDEKPSRLASAFGERREIDNFTEKLVTWAGAYTILFVGFSHVLISGEHFLAAFYLGVLFLANCAGAILAAIGIAWGAYAWAWLLGDLVAGGAFVGFIASRTIGLPGYPEAIGQWTNIAGLLTLGFEGLFLALSSLAITPWGRALTRRVEQGRAQLEQTIAEEEKLEPVEQEMREIRSRMAPDLHDLRKHVEPRGIKEQAKRGLSERLHDVLGSVKNDPRSLVSLIVLALVVLVLRRMASGSD